MEVTPLGARFAIFLHNAGVDPYPSTSFTGTYRKAYRTIDGYIQTVDEKKFNSGITTRVYTEYRNGKKETALIYVLDKANKWIKSKLKYFDVNGKIIKVLKGEKQ